MDGMGHMSMSMVFTTDHSTPLYSSAWTPTTAGAYAATCIFIVVLGIISRMLLAYRGKLEAAWHDKAVERRYVMVAGEPEAERDSPAEKSDEATLTTRGINERVRVVQRTRHAMQGTPWRLSTDLPRACIFTLQAAVGYFLMLAVMTLNVGYFMSALAGLFVGELMVGRYTMIDVEHH
ncbi:ctr copper transporter like protein [Zymoseptoria brevis]|uniref:Copper transport protein n=1 Tax=Zymoseptoria brevis TaxID=1047168 RepID=A0A0F4G4G5_9PEZI|nr:ctr copper transporter like protein [Zymoseptoria brevis]